MSDQIKTISDKANFEAILNKFFKNNNVFLKTKNGDLKIQFVGYSNDTAAFKIPYLKNITENCLIFTRSGVNTIHALLKFIEKEADNTFLFKIDKFQVIMRARGEERKSCELSSDKEGSSKCIVFITNTISYSIIQNSLSMEGKKVESIREYVLKEISQAFSHKKIFFCNEGKGDSRMSYFFKNKKPIFIPKIEVNQEKTPDAEKMNFYLNSIYSKDMFLQGKKEYISEISVPLLYRMKLPYGYIQVNNPNILTSSTLSIVKKFAILLDELLNKEKIFPRSEEKLIVSNLSKNGVGIVFKERKFIRYFKENNLLYFDILLPSDKIASVLAMVRNITLMENNVMRIGCSIEEIDALSEVNFDEFISTIPEKPAQPENSEQTTKNNDSVINENKQEKPEELK